mgnify:CR=1 FL=1
MEDESRKMASVPTSRLLAEAIEIADNASTNSPRYSKILSALHSRADDDVLNTALSLCRDPRPARRKLGTKILGELGSPVRQFSEPAEAVLCDLVRNDLNDEIVAAAAFAIGHRASKRCVDELVRISFSANREIRYGAAFALAATQDVAVAPALLRLMCDSYDRARDWATTGIAGMIDLNTPEVRSALHVATRDSDPQVRSEAFEGLAARREKDAIPALIAELEARTEPAYRFVEAAEKYLGHTWEGDDIGDLVLQLRQVARARSG